MSDFGLLSRFFTFRQKPFLPTSDEQDSFFILRKLYECFLREVTGCNFQLSYCTCSIQHTAAYSSRITLPPTYAHLSLPRTFIFGHHHHANPNASCAIEGSGVFFWLYPYLPSPYPLPSIIKLHISRTQNIPPANRGKKYLLPFLSLRTALISPPQA